MSGINEDLTREIEQFLYRETVLLDRMSEPPKKASVNYFTLWFAPGRLSLACEIGAGP